MLPQFTFYVSIFYKDYLTFYKNIYTYNFLHLRYNLLQELLLLYKIIRLLLLFIILISSFIFGVCIHTYYYTLQILTKRYKRDIVASLLIGQANDSIIHNAIIVYKVPGPDNPIFTTNGCDIVL